MYAIFDKNNNCISIKNEPDNDNKSLEIGKDIQWQIIIKRGCEILQCHEDDRLSEDIVINEKKNIIAHSGTEMQINTNDMLPDDIIIKQFDKQWIKTNENNDFIVKTENERLEEIKIKIIEEYKNSIPMKDYIDNNYTQMVENIQNQINNLDTIDNANLLYNNILKGV